MKQLSRLHISSEKLLDQEELRVLNGGYTACFYWCECKGMPNPPFVSPFSMCAFEPEDVIEELNVKCSNVEGSCYLNFCI